MFVCFLKLLTFTKTKKFNFPWKVWLEVRLVRGQITIAAVLVPHVQALPHHDEEAGHEGGEESGWGGEPEVVRRAKPTDGSDEDGPEEDQPAAEWSTSMSRNVPRSCYASNLIPYRTSSGM